MAFGVLPCIALRGPVAREGPTEVTDMRRENARVNGVEDYRERLLTRKMELLLSLRIRPETLAGPGAVAVEDLAPVFHEQFVALQINQLDLLQLKLVDAALDRMDSEDYGVCVDCGDPISCRRLAAIPWANRCIACQERSTSGQEPEQLVALAA